MHWRLIIHDGANGAWNMAVDEALLWSVAWGQSPPVIRLYAWASPTLSLGYFTTATRLARACSELELAVVRRLSGGGIVLHDCEVTYAVIVPQGMVPNASSVLNSFRWLSRGILMGLQQLGIEATFATDARMTRHERPRENRLNKCEFCFASSSPTDIVVNGKKLVGGAQARRRGVILQHGSVPIRWNCDILSRLDGRIIMSGSNALFTSLEELLPSPLMVSEIRDALIAGFADALNAPLVKSELSNWEMMHARLLLRNKYGSADWTWGRCQKHL